MAYLINAVYDPKTNTYQCPAGELLIEHYRSLESGKNRTTYWSSNCKKCALKSNCSTSEVTNDLPPVQRSPMGDMEDEMEMTVRKPMGRMEH